MDFLALHETLGPEYAWARSRHPRSSPEAAYYRTTAQWRSEFGNDGEQYVVENYQETVRLLTEDQRRELIADGNVTVPDPTSKRVFVLHPRYAWQIRDGNGKPCCLGWCIEPTHLYDDRSVDVRLAAKILLLRTDPMRFRRTAFANRYR
jgi:hypothetical protein